MVKNRGTSRRQRQDCITFQACMEVSVFFFVLEYVLNFYQLR